LVNDTEFALTWVENRSEFRPRGQRALRMELRQKGLSEGVIQQALADLDEESLAYQAARKRAARLSQLEETDFKRKLQSFLARRGFAYETIYEVVNRVWDERNRV
jgi:regulatory protein